VNWKDSSVAMMRDGDLTVHVEPWKSTRTSWSTSVVMELRIVSDATYPSRQAQNVPTEVVSVSNSLMIVFPESLLDKRVSREQSSRRTTSYLCM
jgi:hypothetical protein